MTPLAPGSFSSPDNPGDGIAVLVLLENSGLTSIYWHDIKDVYLPVLLDSLRTGNPGVSMHICWQMTSADQPTSQVISRQVTQASDVPDCQFGLSGSCPVSVAAIRRSIEILKENFRERRVTCHLIVVAVSTPLNGTPPDQTGVNSWYSIAAALAQERVRLHVIRSALPNMHLLSDLHGSLLRLQNSSGIPPWFGVDAHRFVVHLSGKPKLHHNAEIRHGNIAHPSDITSHSSPVTPATTSFSLPASPVHDTPVGNKRLSMSPQARRAKPGKGASTLGSPSDPTVPGLVTYLQQMHGLTKKRTYGAKTTRRSSLNEQTRASGSSRPILPRLDLPPVKLHSWSSRQSPSTMQLAAPGSSTSSQGRHSPTAAVFTPVVAPASEDRRRVRARWPWLQPPSLFSGVSEPLNVDVNANSALQSLASMTPRLPEFSSEVPSLPSHLPCGPVEHNAVHSRENYGNTVYSHSSSRHGSISGLCQNQRLSPSLFTVPSPPINAPLALAQSSVASPILMRHPSVSADPHGYLRQSLESRSYTSSPVSQVTTTLVSSPGLDSESSVPDDSEDQPFVVTPEYEALANAQFEAALRSGAMQASMTPNALTPGTDPISGHAGYFPAVADQADPMASSGLDHPLNGPSRNYYQHSPSQSTVQHDLPSQQNLTMTASHYEFSSLAYDSMARRWYGQ